MDASALVFDLHGMMLRRISENADIHYQGLKQAAADAYRKHLISSPLKAHLIAIDTAFQVIRHISAVSAKKDYHELCCQLNKCPSGDSMNKPPECILDSARMIRR